MPPSERHFNISGTKAVLWSFLSVELVVTGGLDKNSNILGNISNFIYSLNLNLEKLRKKIHKERCLNSPVERLVAEKT